MTSNLDIIGMTAMATGAQLERGELRTVEIATAHLDAVAARDGEVHASTSLDPDHVMVTILLTDIVRSLGHYDAKGRDQLSKQLQTVIDEGRRMPAVDNVAGQGSDWHPKQRTRPRSGFLHHPDLLRRSRHHPASARSREQAADQSAAGGPMRQRHPATIDRELADMTSRHHRFGMTERLTI